MSTRAASVGQAKFGSNVLKSHSELLLYLDFDGVLHPADVYLGSKGPELSQNCAGHRLFEHAEALAMMLATRPEICVVLSTSWVPLFGFDFAAASLPSALQRRVIGATFDARRDHAGYLSVARGYQVAADAKRRRAKRWLAIDDMTGDWPVHHVQRLVRSDPLLGIGDASVRSALMAAIESL